MRNLTVEQLQREVVRLQSRVDELESQVARLNAVTRARRRSERRYRLMLDNINDLVFMVDCEGRFTYISPGLNRFTQYSPPELIGQPIGSFAHPDDCIFVQHSLAETMGGVLTPREFRVVDKDGAVVEVRISSRPLRQRGKVVGVIGVLSNITQQKAVERVLRESEQRLRIMAESLPMPLIITRLSDTTILAANSRVGELFGLPLADVLGQPARFFFYSPREFRQLVLQVHRTGQVRDCEVRARKADGTVFWVAASILPIKFEGEEALVGGFYDLTERKHAEDALRQYAEELQVRNDELDAFAHTVAHDLKSPLSLISGYAELLGEMERLNSDPDGPKYLQTIMQTVDKISNIIDELLLLSAVRKGRVELEPLNMNQIVSEARARLAYLIDASQATVKLDGNWPIALGHASWVEQVWINYLSDALKYGGQSPQIELGCDPATAGQVRFWVRDNGRGLTPAEQTRLFMPFTQLAQVRATGHGLGLSIVRRIIEKLGGTVGVESTIGQGSTFYFTLPALPIAD